MKLPRPFTTNHHRLHLFWGLAVAGLLAPWVTSCEHPPIGALFQEERACVVGSIHDGDTLRLVCDGERVKVRLYCIDAPELAQRPWGQASRDHLQAITPRRVVLVAKDRDRYGRIVREALTVDGRESLNLAQVRTGQAALHPRYCSDRHYWPAEAPTRGPIGSVSGRAQGGSRGLGSGIADDSYPKFAPTRAVRRPVLDAAGK